MMGASTVPAAWYRPVVWILIATSLATLAGRLVRVESKSGKTPFLSANDRSRWSTVRALVDHGTYALDDVIFLEPPPEDDGSLKPPRIRRDGDWYSIDLVKHRGWDGREHYYSSKPPLLATIVAGEYWLLQEATGARLADQPFYVAIWLLIFTNLLPMGIAWWCLSRALESWGRSDWGRLFVMASATWGTLLNPMAVTLNNHTPAAISALFAALSLLRIWRDVKASPIWYASGGFFAAFAAANELPALSLLAVCGAAAFARNWRRTAVVFVPAALVVAAAAFLTTYLAHGTWRPPYAHRSDGAEVARISGETWSQLTQPGQPRPSTRLREELAARQITLSERATLRPAQPGKQGEPRWSLWDPESQRRWALAVAGDGGVCREWDQWYEYEGTYWVPERLRGVDRGEPSRVVYAFHALAGHHGIFSLTPLWLLSIGGGVLGWRQGDRVTRGFLAALLLLTTVCLAFYFARPLIDRNYGGVSCGFRWMFWFIPLWLLAMQPAADAAAASRWRQVIYVILLAASTFTASWSATTPWAHPWLYDYWMRLGWLTPDVAARGGGVGPHGLFDARHHGVGVFPEAFQRRLIGEQVHLVVEPDSVLASTVDQLTLLQVANRIVTAEHGSVTVGIFQEATLFLGTGEQVGAVSVNGAPASVGSAPAASFLESDGAEAVEA